jgi:pilus assembly protein CpaF
MRAPLENDAGATPAVFAPFEDERVDEVLLNGAASAWTVRGDSTAPFPSPFASRQALAAWLLTFARSHGARLDPVVGSAGGACGDFGREVGSSGATATYRWHAVLPPLAPDGPVVTIRRHRFATLETGAFVVDEASGAAMSDLLSTVAARNATVLIAGPTGSGKTTLLAALIAERSRSERLVVVESLAELPPPGGASIRLLERRANLDGHGERSVAHLVREALRLRPDRLVVGEIRGDEAGAFLAAATSGHHGALATIHAGCAAEAVTRLADLASLDGRRSPSACLASLPPLAVALLARGTPPRLVSITQQPRSTLN